MIPDSGDTVGRVWLVGCGNMGGALLARWLAAGLTGITVIDPAIDPAAQGLPGNIVAHSDPPDGTPPGTPDIIVLAVKPQSWREAAAAVAERAGPDTLVISVMAGVAVADLHSVFVQQNVIRVMPNTPARLGCGITALWMPSGRRGRAAAEWLFSAAGQIVWLDREADFDAVTGLSGSGPAYVFAMIEALASAGEAAGLSGALAAKLALATVTGAAALAAEGTAAPAALRAAVTSPNGTTAAGLAVLQPALETLMIDTIAAAADRSRQLSAPSA